jgi:hypothetical protein
LIDWRNRQTARGEATSANEGLGLRRRDCTPAFVLGLIVTIAGPRNAAHIASSAALAWAALTGVFLAASLAIWVVLLQIASSAFGEWLLWRGAMKVYSSAFAHAVLVHATATGSLVLAFIFSSSQSVSLGALALLIFSGINLVTSIRNGQQLLTLQAQFQRCLKEARDAELQTKEIIKDGTGHVE